MVCPPWKKSWLRHWFHFCYDPDLVGLLEGWPDNNPNVTITFSQEGTATTGPRQLHISNMPNMIDGGAGYSLPLVKDGFIWVQADFKYVYRIKGLLVLGGNTHYPRTLVVMYRPTSYKGNMVVPSFSTDNMKVQYYTTDWVWNRQNRIVFAHVLWTSSIRTYLIWCSGVCNVRLEILGHNHAVYPFSTQRKVVPLGMEKRGIANYQLRCSSQRSWLALCECGRKNYQKTLNYYYVWEPASYYDLNSWYLVDLLVIHEIIGADVKGYEAGNNYCKTWQFQYSNNLTLFETVNGTDGSIMTFTRDNNLKMEYVVKFPKPVLARYIRFHPKSYYYRITLQVEYYGFINDPTELTSSDVATVLSTAPMDTTKCESPQGNNIMSGVQCRMWCPQVTAGDTANLTIRFIFYNYINTIVLSQEAPKKTNNTVIYVKKSEKDYVTLESYGDYVVKTINDTNGTTFSKEYYYMDHPVMAENMTISVVAESSFCMNISLFGRKVESCPVGYYPSMGKCYSYHYIGLTKNDSLNRCKRDDHKWPHPFGIAAPVHASQVETIIKLLFWETNNFWIDIGRIGSDWGSTDAVKTNFTTWASGQPRSTYNYSYWYRNAMYTNVATAKYGQVCQTKAINKQFDSIDWHYFPATTDSNTDGTMAYKTNFLTECVYACAINVLPNCKSAHWRRSGRTCLLSPRDRMSSNFTRKSDTYVAMYEKYIPEENDCNVALLESTLLKSVSISSNNGSTAYDIVHGRKLPASSPGFWRPGISDRTPYVKIIFHTPVLIRRLLTRGTGLNNKGFYIRQMYLEVSKSLKDWEKVEVTDNLQYSYMQRSILPYVHVFQPVLVIIAVKFYPTYWSYLGGQIQFYGCRLKESTTCYESANSFGLTCAGRSTVLLKSNALHADSYKKNYEDMTSGFEENNGDTFWIGGSKAYKLTLGKQLALRMEMWDDNSTFLTAEFDFLSFGETSQNFLMKLGVFLKGSAGHGSMAKYSFPLGTTDNDITNMTCMTKYTSAWWYRSGTYNSKARCLQSILVPNDQVGISWTTLPRSKIKRVLWKTGYAFASHANIALEKTVVHNPTVLQTYKSKVSVDGDITPDLLVGSCSQTGPATTSGSLWWRVDLEKKFPVEKIEIYGSSCCMNEVADLDIFTGTESSDGDFANNGYTQCATTVGATPDGEKYTLTCSSVQEAQFVGMVRKGTGKLTICDVAIRSKDLDLLPLDEPCEWNADCSGILTECRPPSAGGNTTCQCQLYHERQHHNICIPVTDLKLELTSFDIMDTTELVRYTNLSSQFEITIFNELGAPVDINKKMTTEPGPNFRLKMWFSDADGLTSKYNDTVWTSNYNLTLPAYGKKIIKENSNFSFSADICFHLKYLCIQVEPVGSLVYKDVNISNNYVCLKPNYTITCQPDVDLNFTKVYYQGSAPIIRGTVNNNVFNVTLKHINGTEDIAPLFWDEHHNYNATYAYTTKVVNNYSDYSALTISKGEFVGSDSRVHLPLDGSVNVSVVIPKGMTVAECKKTTHICIFIHGAPMQNLSSFTDNQLDNNVLCYNITTLKVCSPVMKVTASTFSISQPTFKFVRGYYDVMEFQLELRNDDPTYDVVVTQSPDVNYNFSMAIADSSMGTTARKKRSTPLVKYFPTVINANLLKSDLARNTSMTVNGTANIIINRTDCVSISHVCVVVLPGNGSSYSLATGTSHIKCVAADTYKLCDGVKTENLTVVPETVFAEQNALQSFGLAWDKGSDVILTIDYGDGQTLRWAWDEQNHTLSYMKKNITLSHNYTVLANRTLSVTATNQAGTVTATAKIVVEPNLQKYVNYSAQYTPGPTPLPIQFSFKLLPTVTSPIPVIFWCNLTYDDPSNTIQNNSVYGEINGNTFLTPHTYKTDRAFSTPSMLCFNHISQVPFNDNITLRQNVTGLKISSTQMAWRTTDDAASIIIAMDRGSHIYLDIDYGDGTTNTSKHPERVSAGKSVNFTHTYSTPNNYTIKVKAYNEYYNDVANYSLILQNKVQGITITPIPPVAYPPGTFSLSLEPDSSLPTPTNMWFNATLTGLSIGQEIYSHAVSTGTTHTGTITVGRGNVGENQDIVVTGYNLASSMNFTTSISVYEVITGLTLTPVPKTSLPNETWELHIKVATGSTVNYTVNFGDGDIREVSHTELFASSSAYVLSKNYTTVNNYTVVVTAINRVSTKTASFVHEWACYPPNITLPDEVNDESKPKQVFKAMPYNFKPELYLVCIDTQTVLYQWSVLDYSTKALQSYTTTNSTFHLPARTLHYGKYIIRLNTSMWNEVNTTATADAYIEIIKTPLVAFINKGPGSGTVFGKTASVDASERSLDLDMNPGSQKQGLSFRWECERNYSEPILDELTKKNATLKELADNSQGCFSQPAGQLSFTTGSFTGPSTMMLPFTSYVLSVEVSKDTRKATYVQDFKVAAMDPPLLNIRCRENCAPKKKWVHDVVVRADCLALCKTEFGNAVFEWSLKLLNDVNRVLLQPEQVALGNISIGGTESQAVIIKGKSLVPGGTYSLDVTSWTLGSYKNVTSLQLAVNVPPYGGSCTVTPLTGYSSFTNFVMDCARWLEFQKTIATSILEYDFRIRMPGSKRSFPVFFGNKTTSDPCLFPVGDMEQGFALENVIHIIDSLGDFVEFVMTLKVIPQPIPVADILAGLDNVATNVASLIASGSYQSAATNAFAAISEINVPLSYFHITPGGNDSDYDALTKRKRALRTQLAKLVAQLPITQPQYLEQSNELMRTLLKVPGDIEVDALDVCSAHLGRMKDKFFEFKRNGIVENPRGMGGDIIDTSIKVMIAGNFINDATPKPDPNATTVDNTTAAATDAVHRVMRNTVGVLDEVMQFLSDVKDPNDPDDIMNYKEMDLAISKVASEKLQGKKANFTWGELTINSTKDLFGDKVYDCVDTKMVFGQFNPYIYGKNNTPDIGSSILRFEVKDCSSSSRKKRSTSNSTSDNSIPGNVTMTLSSNSLPDMTYMNITPNGTLGMIYHTFTVPDSPKSIEISLKPVQENETYDLYIRKLLRADLTTFDIKVTLPRNASSENETFSYLIPARNVTPGLLYVGVKKTPDPEEPATGSDWGNMEYYFRILELKCRVWLADVEQWNDTDFEVESSPTSTRMKFKSNLLGSLGAGLNVKPNMINFATVFDDLGAKIVENIAVVLTVLGIIVLYIPATVFLRRLDLSDIIKWQCLPLLDCYDGDKHQYEIHVFTGNAKGAETTSDVSMIITGTEGDTGVRKLKAKENQVFKRGQVSYFTLTTPNDLGYLYSIRIWHENNGEGAMKSWQLGQIIVVDHQREIWYLFPCDKWLDENHGDGKVGRLLVLSSAAEEDKGKLMRTNIRRRFYNDHLWVSLTSSAWRTKFTRVQRISCILAIFYLSMITNAMFYRDPGDSTGSSGGTITIGSLQISVNDLITGFISSLIVVIPITAIVFGFVYSARKPKKCEKEGPKVYDGVNNSGLPGVHRIHDKKKVFKLPHWFIYVAWVLVFLSVAASAFFTMLYSFGWGRKKSTAWLVAFLFSNVSNVFFVEPMKIAIITMIISFYFGESSLVKEYERDYGRRCDFYEVNHYFTNETDLDEVLEVLAAQSSGDVAKKQKLDNAVSKMFKDCAKQILFVILLLLVMYSNQDSQLYHQNRALRDQFMSHKAPKAPIELYTVMKKNLVPKMYHDKLMNGANTTTYERKFISHKEGFRLGSPKIIQLRTLPGHCKIHRYMEKAMNRCGPGYAFDKEDKKTYLPHWKTYDNHSYYSVIQNNPVGQAFTYRTGTQLNRQVYWGALTTYGGGGYAINLGYNSTKAGEVINNLQKYHWLDRHTRAVFIEANLLNMDSNLFSVIRLVYEFPEYGGCFTRHRIETLELYRYNGGSGLLAILFEILALLMYFILLVLCIKDIFVALRKNNPIFDFWMVLRIMLLTCFSICMICYILRTISTTKTLEEVMNNRESAAGFESVVTATHYFLIFLGFSVFIAHVELLYILRYNNSISLFTITLRRAGTELLSMGLIGGVILIAFGSYMTLLFGTSLLQYSSFTNTVTTLAQASLNKYDYYSVKTAFGKSGSFVLTLYLLFISIAAMNFFITLLNFFLEETSDDPEAMKNESEVIDHLVSIVKSFVASDSSNSKDKDDCDIEDKNFEEQLDKADNDDFDSSFVSEEAQKQHSDLDESIKEDSQSADAVSLRKTNDNQNDNKDNQNDIKVKEK